MTEYLVTSGCSFSDNVLHFYKDGTGRWPHHLADSINRKLINYGCGSAGNDYIADSTIYALQNLLNNNVSSEDIIAVVMWSGIDRHGHFVSKNETYDYDRLINAGAPNPVNYLNMFQYPEEGIHCPNSNIDRGWIVGSPNCGWENKEILKLKKLDFEKFYTYENRLYNSFNKFLQLQWFCELNKIKLYNLTIKKIFPDSLDQYTTVQHLYAMINFDNWIFWDTDKGLYEYTLDHKQNFYDDHFHPTPGAHKYFVDNFLREKIND